MDTNQSPQPVLKATYNSPTNAAFELTTPLPSLQNPSSSTTATAEGDADAIAQRTAYLQALRKSATEMQERINAELTARMEEDNQRNAATNGGEGKGAGAGKSIDVDDEKEEENYGEEVVEEED